MRLVVEIENNNDMERFVLTSVVGLLSSYQNKALTLNECENYMFSPYVVEKLRDLNIKQSIIEVVELGCELEDIESLLPNELEYEVSKLKDCAIRLLSELAGKESTRKNWIVKRDFGEL